MKKTLKRFFMTFSVISPFVAMGLFLGITSWDKNLYVQWNPSKKRGLASVGDSSSPELLNLSYEQLVQRASSVLFSKHKVVRKGENTSFYLGNVLVPDSYSKSYRFICQIFPLVEFSFSALGISLSGEEGVMLVQSPCNSNEEDEVFMGPFWVPHKRILASPSQEYFDMPEKGTSIRFYKASIVLTSSWLLKSVRFFNEAERDRELLVRFEPGEGNPHFELSLR